MAIEIQGKSVITRRKGGLYGERKTKGGIDGGVAWGQGKRRRSKKRQVEEENGGEGIKKTLYRSEKRGEQKITGKGSFSEARENTTRSA